MTEQRCVIEGWLPDQVANHNLNHWVRRKALADAKQTAGVHLRAAALTPVKGKARLEIVLVFPNQRRRDIDNLTSRCKGVIDALVGVGLIEDDDMEHLLLVVGGRVEPRRKAVEMTLSEAA